MKEAKIEPNEVTFNTLMNKVTDYEDAKSVLAEMKEAKIEPNLLTYCTLLSKDTKDISIEEIHNWYLNEEYHPASAFEPLIKNLFNKGRMNEAFYLILNYPQLDCARKIVLENFSTSLSKYEFFKEKQCYEQNIDYALGIAYFDVGRLEKSSKHLNRALSIAKAKQRVQHIENLFVEITKKYEPA